MVSKYIPKALISFCFAKVPEKKARIIQNNIYFQCSKSKCYKQKLNVLVVMRIKKYFIVSKLLTKWLQKGLQYFEFKCQGKFQIKRKNKNLSKDGCMGLEDMLSLLSVCDYRALESELHLKKN